MNEITIRLGQRIRSYRLQKGLSQEKLSELADCHPTYIGQIERGEKNATLESIYKISAALNITLSDLFYKLDDLKSEEPQNNMTDAQNIPLECYDLLLSKRSYEQKQLYRLIEEIEKYKNI